MPMRMRVNGKPGEYELSLTVFSRVFLAVMTAAILGLLGQGFFLWRDMAVVKTQLATACEWQKEHVAWSQHVVEQATIDNDARHRNTDERIAELEAHLASCCGALPH